MAVVSVVACCRPDGCLIVRLLVRSWPRIDFVWCYGVLSLRWLCNCVLVGAQLAENWFCMVVSSVMACCRPDDCVFVDLCCCAGF